MIRSFIGFVVLTGALGFGAHARAESSENQSRVLLTTNVYSSLLTGLDNPAPGAVDDVGFAYPSANLGLRIGIGQGRWSSDPRVYLGHMANGGDFVSGYTVGIWARNDSPSPSIAERRGAVYGMSFTHYSSSDEGRLLVNTVEAGSRFSIDASGDHTMASGSPLGQAVVGLTTQGLLLNNVLLGPSLELRIGNERAPWSGQVGIRVSI
ncbi:MAG TPA: hypothetical protein DFR83_12685 [Deltaproteobacteria bacterium]|nr:hypothetical protein [Deltaproteobacteria bacterium]